jgi:hypothetical protein
VIDELDVEATGTAWFGEKVSMRWVLIHMIVETARHAGHMDIPPRADTARPVTTAGSELRKPRCRSVGRSAERGGGSGSGDTAAATVA